MSQDNNRRPVEIILRSTIEIEMENLKGALHLAQMPAPEDPKELRQMALFIIRGDGSCSRDEIVQGMKSLKIYYEGCHVPVGTPYALMKTAQHMLWGEKKRAEYDAKQESAA